MESTAPIVFRSDQVESLWAYASPVRMVRDLLSRRQLIGQFTAREVRGRYRGSYLGIVWALITPLLILTVYTFVFSVVYGSQWYGDNGHPIPGVTAFALHMFTGIIIFQVFVESVQTAPSLIVLNPNYVKKVVFPLEVLPMSLVGSALVHSLLSIVIAGIGELVFHQGLHWTLLLLPLVFAPLIALTLGMCWLLASLGVFIRDIGNVIGVVTNLLFFVTPIMYPMSRVPPNLRLAMWMNPLAGLVENARRLVNDGQAPNWSVLATSWVIGGIVAIGGYAWFMKIKRAFADVI